MKRTGMLLAGLCLLIGLTMGQANASTYTLSYIFNGYPTISGSDWLTASFENAGTDLVKLTLSANLSNPDYFFQQVAFNVNPGIAPSALSFEIVPASDNKFITSMVHTTQNAQFLPGGGDKGTGFDILFDFTTANKETPIQDRFNNHDTIVFYITGAGVDETDFNFLNTTGAANVGAHIALGGTVSSGITNVPIPGALVIFGSGLVGIFGIRRRMRA